MQDCAGIIVNYDLPRAIIRLIQRAGRVDRIGQQSDKILWHISSSPRTARRRANHQPSQPGATSCLKENAEVVGTDEACFEDDEKGDSPLLNLYHEKSAILDGDDDTEVDLASYAYQIWKNAIDANPELEKIIQAMPNVVYSARSAQAGCRPDQPEAARLSANGRKATTPGLGQQTEGKSVTESQFTILSGGRMHSPIAASCRRHDHHHEMVAQGVKLIVETEKSVGGQLGRPSGARFRTYERLKAFADEIKVISWPCPRLT